MNFLYFKPILNRCDPVKSMPYVLALLAFVLPLSSTGLGVALGLMIVTFIAGFKDYKSLLLETLLKPYTLVLVAFLLWVVLACLWSPASGVEQLAAIKKYVKLLCFPLLIVAFANPFVREWALRAFLLAMLVCVFLVFVQWIGRLNFGHYQAVGSLFRNYIMMGHMMALACYLTAWRALTDPAKRWIYVGLFVLYSVEILFLSEGRTGYILYFGLLLLLMIQRFNVKQCLLGAASLIIFAVVTFNVSQSFRMGFETLVDDVRQYQTGIEDTSVGTRLQFQAFAKKLFLQKPWIGQGTAGFAHFIEVENPVPNWDQDKLREPHNQYWLIAVEFGLVGLVCFGLFFLFLGYAIMALPTMRPFAFAVLFPFLVGNMSDSLLYYSGSGYFFLVMMALCLVENVRKTGSIENSVVK